MREYRIMLSYSKKNSKIKYIYIYIAIYNEDALMPNSINFSTDDSTVLLYRSSMSKVRRVMERTSIPNINAWEIKTAGFLAGSNLIH
jgi:hypothetical protein